MDSLFSHILNLSQLFILVSSSGSPLNLPMLITFLLLLILLFFNVVQTTYGIIGSLSLFNFGGLTVKFYIL